jgi:hypothetical protein
MREREGTLDCLCSVFLMTRTREGRKGEVVVGPADSSDMWIRC